jgi:ABC-type tungstate transport system permease subunit
MNSLQNNGEYIYEPNIILRGNGSGRHNAEIKIWRYAAVIGRREQHDSH